MRLSRWKSHGAKMKQAITLLLRAILTFLFLQEVAGTPTRNGQPFLIKINNETALIGNDFWNVTIGRQYGTKLYYKGVDLVGKAVGHYVSYNGAQSDLNLTNAYIYKKTEKYTDIAFIAKEGEFHWVLTPTLTGAYQYFVNKALPTLGEFRTLWRLANDSFTTGHTEERDQVLPTRADIIAATNVQDETWQRADGTFITKYDFSAFLPVIEDQLSYWGVYGSLAGGNGEKVGSWYVHGGKDYFNGNHLKQELMVHRETQTGDTVQLNMIHGTHFQAVSSDVFPVGKTWGPWLWYLNDGSISDVEARAKQENSAWPYDWFNDDLGFHTRGKLSGRIILSDGRPASGAAVFLGDNNSNLTALDQGAWYYYRTYADKDGNFKFDDVREGVWALQAWANGGSLGDVTTTFKLNDVSTVKGKETKIGKLTWATQGRKKIWQIGEIDRKATGFSQSGLPRSHGRVALCPANSTFTIGVSSTSDWCYAQGVLGTRTVAFNIPSLPVAQGNGTAPAAVLSIALAGYSAGVSGTFRANGVAVGSLTTGTIPTDPSVYRSGTLAGEWNLYQFTVPAAVLKTGANTVDFQITRNTTWRGFMYDSILLEWA
ncbi:Rhamnogalacturonate lyase 1 [Phlyctema vagabunda]|uniref:rhamnogalacturonan endolyase n=1 Tax=Phlyctema vagabunda TaxID=108571 RepID=A0ABR4PT53_9HELO